MRKQKKGGCHIDNDGQKKIDNNSQNHHKQGVSDMSATVSVREYILLHGSCPVFDRTQQAEDMIEIHFLSQDSEDAEMESPKKNLELPLRIETDQKECGQIEEKAVEGFQSKEYERIFPHAAVCGPYGAEKTGSVIDAPLFGGQFSEFTVIPAAPLLDDAVNIFQRKVENIFTVFIWIF